MISASSCLSFCPDRPQLSTVVKTCKPNKPFLSNAMIFIKTIESKPRYGTQILKKKKKLKRKKTPYSSWKKKKKKHFQRRISNALLTKLQCFKGTTLCQIILPTI